MASCGQQTETLSSGYDVVILNGRVMDPETVTDNAGYKIDYNGLPSSGIPYVLVNGIIMVKDSKVQDGVYPGQAIRYPVEEKGRWIPLEKESYLEELLVPEFPEDVFDHGAE